jgi:two-component system, OmpR family, response regulator
MAYKVLIVDDDAAVRKVLRAALTVPGIQVFEASSPAEARACLETTRIDLATIDIMLGREDGLALADELRQHRQLAIVMVTVRNSKPDRIAALERIADDFIAKPFDIDEVVARVRAVLRRMPGARDSAAPESKLGLIVFDDWQLRMHSREVVSPTGEGVELTAREFDLLQLFLAHPNRILSRAEIVQMTEPDAEPGDVDRAIDMRVQRLRRKLGDDLDQAPRFIRTVRGAGYKFSATVINRQAAEPARDHAALSGP